MRGKATPPRTGPHRPLLRPLRAAALATALLAPAMWTSPALAQQAEDPNARATARYEAGQAAAKKGRWQEAYAAFREAWSLRKHPQIALNLGRAALKIGQPREAADRLSYFLREVKDLAPADKKQVEVLLVDARKKVGSLTIGVNRQDAEFFVDGESVGKGARTEEVFVDPGEHQVEARVDGGETARAEVEAKAGTRQHVGLWVVEGGSGAPTTTGPAISTYSTEPAGESGARPYLLGIGITGTLVGAAGAATLAGLAAGADGYDRKVLFNASFWSAGAAGVLALTTLGVLVLVPSHSGNEASVQVEARANGVMVRGSW
ncbi:tetratricopeptide repeat protein [Chondromyces apiculatus]|uniref:PEGA domain-containing protein n=1 Tax=Chondromyces apiculatus DSM 436 TaxID=1192034 RepID=A0A017T1A5_9BACT|nr:hypothetical protein [Chondromyces apiculatus]EYF02605.1 Hypothetical protein CAP_6634 [Chondromyces apiculatus DSM 436]